MAETRGCRTAQSRLAGAGCAKLGQGRKGGAMTLGGSTRIWLARALWAVADRLDGRIRLFVSGRGKASKVPGWRPPSSPPSAELLVGGQVPEIPLRVPHQLPVV